MKITINKETGKTLFTKEGRNTLNPPQAFHYIIFKWTIHTVLHPTILLIRFTRHQIYSTPGLFDTRFIRQQILPPQLLVRGRIVFSRQWGWD